MEFKNNFYLRDASEADMDLLYKWVNDPEVRKNAFHTEPISYTEHISWFQRILKDEECVQYIFMEENEAVGQIRFNIEADEAVIDYSIAPKMRGKGYGKILLKMGTEKFKETYPAIKKIIGQVKKENTVSKKCFSDIGFKEVYTQFELCNEE